MKLSGRKKTVWILATLGICLVGATLALNVGWILLNVRQLALLITGGVLYLTIAAGLMVYTILLVREIRLNDAQENFLNAVTHELKTPVASLRLFTDTLKHRHTQIDEAARLKIFETMQRETDRLTQTIDQLLKAAHNKRDSISKKVNYLETIELKSLTQSCIDETVSRFQMPESSITLKADGLFFTLGHNDDLQTAIKNLLENAVKYSPKNRVKVLVHLNETPKGISLDVIDHGVGMTEKEKKSVFKKFYRAPSTSTLGIKGTGLGLSIVESVIRSHRGRISIPFSKLNVGTTFRVELKKQKSSNKNGHLILVENSKVNSDANSPANSAASSVEIHG